MPRYSLTSQAEVDLKEIIFYIAQDNIDAALSLEARFTKVFELVADNPRVGVERPNISSDLRSFPEGNYLVFYRVCAGEVLIVRVLHAARGLDDIFS